MAKSFNVKCIYFWSLTLLDNVSVLSSHDVSFWEPLNFSEACLRTSRFLALMCAAGFANLTCIVCVNWFSIVFYCSFQFEAWIDLLKILIMNTPTKRFILERINLLKEMLKELTCEVEEMLKELTCEVEECYEFGRRARELFEVGDTVGFNHPRFLPGCKFYKGKEEQVNSKERKFKVFCKYYPKRLAHKQPFVCHRNEWPSVPHQGKW